MADLTAHGAHIFAAKMTATVTESLVEHIGTIDRYLQYGMEPGSCTRAMLAGDFFQACANADEATSLLFIDIAGYILHRLPPASFGSYAKVDAWIKQGGMATQGGE